MKISERWIREWIDIPGDVDRLAAELTMLGLEVDEVEPAGPSLDGVVVGEIVEVAAHPDADRLRVCQVDDGGESPVQVVCGAPNARTGLKAPFARVGSTLPGDIRIRRAKLRGVESFGMLCSASELELAEQRAGLFELSAGAVVGQPLVEHLSLDDRVLTVELTPDRGDCLSVLGVARDLGAKLDSPLRWPELSAVASEIDRRIDVDIDPSSGCARFTARVIDGFDNRGGSPTWLVERLRRAGLRSVNRAVDVTNLVMLELGQPMHAFDGRRLEGGLVARAATGDERLILLDGREVVMQPDTTVIADANGAVGLAGIMGGEATAVTEETTTLVLESALFLPASIVGKPRAYAALSESSHRFERGVDPLGQRRALERATRLLQEIGGGAAGPVSEAVDESRLPIGAAVTLRRERLDRLLGVSIDDTETEGILERLGVGIERIDATSWRVTPPSHRYDLRIEEDYVEEVGRVFGYARIPRTTPVWRGRFGPASETRRPIREIRRELVYRGYREVVTFSFVDAALQARFRPDLESLALANPISSDLAVMRTSLLPGLVDTARRNVARQRRSMRLFETGQRFVTGAREVDPLLAVDLGVEVQLEAALWQQDILALLVMGDASATHWSDASRPLDFFDLKGDIEALYRKRRDVVPEFEAIAIDGLHPGQSARIRIDGVAVGYCGRLHPALQRDLELPAPPFLFEAALASVREATVPEAASVSRYPRVRRDVALLVDESVSYDALVAALARNAPPWLQAIESFDLYRGAGIEPTHKSVALGLIMQHSSRTLEDSEVDTAVARMIEGAATEVGARLRT